MNDTSKLLLTVVIGGTLLGAGLSRYASPTMNQAPGSDWRERYRAAYSDTSMQYVDAGPIDLTPSLTWPGGPFGLHAMSQAPLDYGPDYGARYAADLALMSNDTGDGTEDLVTDPASEPETPAPPVQQALQAAVVAAETLDHPSGEPANSAPSVNRMVSPNSLGSANTLPSIGTPTPL